jgi:hypothetical protein
LRCSHLSHLMAVWRCANWWLMAGEWLMK